MTVGRRSPRVAWIAAAALVPTLTAVDGRGAPPAEIVRRVGNVTCRVDLEHAFPGGVVVVRLSSRGRLGAAWALLDGRRAPFYLDHGRLRALVPVAVTTPEGPARLGVGLAARGGEQRIAISIEVAARDFASRSVSLSEAKRQLLDRPEADHDARRLLGVVRTESKTPVPGVLIPPVGTTGGGFGERRTYSGLEGVESRTDGLLGDYHRGVDYAVIPGTPVRSPAAGTVLLAGPLTLSGETVVIDHGQGVTSVLEHLSRIDVQVGDEVRAGAFVGLSGDSGLASEPTVQWRLYLHAVPVDPLTLGTILG
jgi:murein DD-endopeptidase MepM/ murein hydrolase activator NlpD